MENYSSCNKKFEIWTVVNFRIVKIDDVVYEELLNLSAYDSMRKIIKINDMLIIILTE